MAPALVAGVTFFVQSAPCFNPPSKGAAAMRRGMWFFLFARLDHMILRMHARILQTHEDLVPLV